MNNLVVLSAVGMGMDCPFALNSRIVSSMRIDSKKQILNKDTGRIKCFGKSSHISFQPVNIPFTTTTFLN